MAESQILEPDANATPTVADCFVADSEWLEQNDGDTAPTFVASFEAVRHLIDNQTRLTRPNRTKPLDSHDEDASDIEASVASESSPGESVPWAAVKKRLGLD
jgi:hypothetical protein